MRRDVQVRWVDFRSLTHCARFYGGRAQDDVVVPRPVPRWWGSLVRTTPTVPLVTCPAGVGPDLWPSRPVDVGPDLLSELKTG